MNESQSSISSPRKPRTAESKFRPNRRAKKEGLTFNVWKGQKRETPKNKEEEIIEIKPTVIAPGLNYRDILSSKLDLMQRQSE